MEKRLFIQCSAAYYKIIHIQSLFDKKFVWFVWEGVILFLFLQDYLASTQLSRKGSLLLELLGTF